MSLFDDGKGWIVQRRKGTSDDPYVSKKENLTVDLNKVVLTEIPQEFPSIKVYNTDKEFFVKTSGVADLNNVVVDFQTGYVFFDSFYNGQQFTFEYMGTGQFYLNSQRIYTQTDENGDVTETLKSLTDDTRLAKEDTISATNNANTQASYAKNQGDYAKGIRDNFGHKGNYSPTATYKNGNVVTYGGINYICIQDTTAGIDPLNGAYWTVISPQASINQKTWTATEGQTVFTITNGSYVVNQGNIEVLVGGVPQVSGIGFTETNSTTITLSESVSAGTIVFAKWFEGTMSITKGHKNSHELGGQDELDITKLKNFQEQVASPLADKATKTEVNTAIANMGSASPKGVYATLTALQTAFPTGTTGIYVVSADGKWYYWSGSAWTVGGTYQGTKIAEKTITPELMSDIMTAFNGYNCYAAKSNDDILLDFVFDLNPIKSLLTTSDAYKVGFEIYTTDPNIKQIGSRLFFNNSATAGNPLNGSSLATNYFDTLSSPYQIYNKTRENYATLTYQYCHLIVLVNVADRTKFSTYNVKNVTLSIGTNVATPLNVTPAYYNPTAGSTVNKISQLDVGVVKYSDYKTKTDSLQNQVNGIQDPTTVSKWKNKVWNAVGDSITEVNGTASTKYHDVIKNKIGCTVNNYGLSGTGYATAYNASPAIVDRYSSMADADLITIFAGTNDWGRNLTTLGAFGDNTNATFYGALNLTLSGLINKYPTKTIAVFTPIPRNTYRNGNTAGETLKQYRDAIIQTCEYYSIPCLDLYKESNFYATNSTFNTAFLPDGLHPNDAGHAILADKILAFLNRL